MVCETGSTTDSGVNTDVAVGHKQLARPLHMATGSSHRCAWAISSFPVTSIWSDRKSKQFGYFTPLEDTSNSLFSSYEFLKLVKVA